MRKIGKKKVTGSKTTFWPDPEIFEEIRSKKTIEKDLEENLIKALNDFKATFAA